MYNFFTAESPYDYTFKGHTDTVKCITWLEDDSGFITSGKDNDLALWRLHPGTGDGANLTETNPIWKFSSRKAVFNAVWTHRPENKLPIVYVAASDKTVREVTQKSCTSGKVTDVVSQGQENIRYEENVIFS